MPTWAVVRMDVIAPGHMVWGSAFNVISRNDMKTVAIFGEFCHVGAGGDGIYYYFFLK